MFRALETAATGLHAQELVLDTVTHNLANSQTTGFKSSNVSFQDLMYKNINTTPHSQTRIGFGTKVSDIKNDFSQGKNISTGRPLDCAIQGNGFFRAMKPNGEIVYTRDGNFNLSSEGQLVTRQGYVVMPDILIPTDAAKIEIDRSGMIRVMYPNDSVIDEIGQIELSRFTNNSGLKNIGENFYAYTEHAGEEIIGYSTDEHFGEIHQGSLESSNVNMVNEMMKMISAQRAYELLAKTVKVSDEMMKIANNMRE